MWRLIPCLMLLASTSGAANIPEGMTLEDMSGTPTQLHQYIQDRVTVLLLWKGCCPTGKRVLVELDELRSDFEEQDVVFMAVNMDSPRNASQVEAWLRSKDFGFLLLRDPEMRLARLLDPGGLQPYTLLLDRQGSLVHSVNGYRSGDYRRLKTRISELLETTPE